MHRPEVFPVENEAFERQPFPIPLHFDPAVKDARGGEREEPTRDGALL